MRNIFVAMALAAATSMASAQEAVVAASRAAGIRFSRGNGKGKGKGKSKKTGGATPWKQILKGQTNGARECARRVNQIQRKAG